MTTCKCSHPATSHGRDKKGRTVCWSLSCGCIQLRPKDEK